MARRYGQVRAVGRAKRVQGQEMMRVGEDELLVLLFVVKAEFHDGERFFVESTGIDRAFELFVHVLAVGENGVEIRSREKPALGSVVWFSDAVVVRVEDRPIVAVKGLVRFDSIFEDEGFEEPAHVSQVPLCWTGVLHRLGTRILGRKRPRQ